MSTPFYIFEGPDGVGKTSLGKFIANQKRGFYIHMTGQIGNQARYHHSVLQFIKWNLTNSDIPVILDRCWISDMIYGPYTNPNEQGMFPYKEHDKAIQEMNGLYIICDSNTVMERHKEQPDTDHPYPEHVFEKIIRGYQDLAISMSSRDDVVFYNLEDHGADMPNWIAAHL